jgi:hypothetical protein
MKKFFVILSLFLLPVRLQSIRMRVDVLKSHRLPYR